MRTNSSLRRSASTVRATSSTIRSTAPAGPLPVSVGSSATVRATSPDHSRVIRSPSRVGMSAQER